MLMLNDSTNADAKSAIAYYIDRRGEIVWA
jgi:hypothetical protein